VNPQFSLARTARYWCDREGYRVLNGQGTFNVHFPCVSISMKFIILAFTFESSQSRRSTMSASWIGMDFQILCLLSNIMRRGLCYHTPVPKIERDSNFPPQQFPCFYNRITHHVDCDGIWSWNSPPGGDSHRGILHGIDPPGHPRGLVSTTVTATPLPTHTNVTTTCSA
jgi:hypothetical protein